MNTPNPTECLAPQRGWCLELGEGRSLMNSVTGLACPGYACGQRPRPTNNSPGVYWSCIGVAKHSALHRTASCSVPAQSWGLMQLLYWQTGSNVGCRHPSAPIVPRTENADAQT